MSIHATYKHWRKKEKNELIQKIFLSVKMQLRVPVSIFFSLIFPIIMMTVIVTSYGNFSIGDGYHFIDKYLLISVGIGLIPITVISFPIWIGESIDGEIYKRLRYLGVNLNTYIVADVCSYFFLSLISIFANITVAKYAFKAHLPNPIYLLAYVLQSEYCVLTFLIMGFLIARLVKSTRILLPLGMTILFSLYILSGVFVQFSSLPANLKTIGRYLPWKYVMNDFYNIWIMKQYWVPPFIKINSIWLLCLIMLILGLLLLEKKREY